MAFLDKYKYVTNYGVSFESYKPYVPPVHKKRKYVPPEVPSITVADGDIRSRDFITAHDLRDYRRTSFNLVLLPKVDLAFDVIAKEVYGLGECL